MGQGMTLHTHRHSHKTMHPDAIGRYVTREHTHGHRHTGILAGSYGEGASHRPHAHTPEQERELRAQAR